MRSTKNLIMTGHVILMSLQVPESSLQQSSLFEALKAALTELINERMLDLSRHEYNFKHSLVFHVRDRGAPRFDRA